MHGAYCESNQWQASRLEFSHANQLSEGDQYTCVEFNSTGELLAVGDRGGRITVFKSNTEQNGLYNIYCAFTSHEPEFDYLKSLEIEEKINSITWLGEMTSAHHLLSANDKTVKLWRLSERHQEAYNFNSRDDEGTSLYLPSEVQPDDVHGPPVPRLHCSALLRVPQFRKSQHLIVEARLRRVFSNAHTYHINAISLNSDQETFLSADDLRINLWHLDVSNQSFTIVDLKPPNMEDLSEVVTCARFHPSLCYLLAYSTSKGVVRLCDMRARALCDNHVLVFEDPRSSHNFGFFADIIASLSDFRFSHSGQHILARDYLNLKVWDIRMGDRPCEVYPVHEPFRSQLCMLYENDAIFDKFTCSWSRDDRYLITGSYGRTFRIFDRHTGSESLYSLSPAQPDPFGSASPQEEGVDGLSLPAGGICLSPQRFICPGDPIGSCLGLTTVCVAPSHLVDDLLTDQASVSPDSCQSRATTGSRTTRSASCSSSSAGSSCTGNSCDEAVKTTGEGDPTGKDVLVGLASGDGELDTAAPSLPTEPVALATVVDPCQQQANVGAATAAHSVSRDRRSRRKSPNHVYITESVDGSSESVVLDESCQMNGYPMVANGGCYLSSSASLGVEVPDTTNGEHATTPANDDPVGVANPASADKGTLAVDMLQLRRRIDTLQASNATTVLHDHQQVPSDLLGDETLNTDSTTNNGMLSLPGVRQLDCHCKLLHMTWHPHRLIAAAISGGQIYLINNQSERITSLRPSSASPLPVETESCVGPSNRSVLCEHSQHATDYFSQQAEDGRLETNDCCDRVLVDDGEEHAGEESDEDDEDYEEAEDATGESSMSPEGPHQPSTCCLRLADDEKGFSNYSQHYSVTHLSTGVPHSPPIRVGRKRRRRHVPNGENSLSAESSDCSSPKKDAPGLGSNSTLPPMSLIDDNVGNGSQQTGEIAMDYSIDCDKTEVAVAAVSTTGLHIQPVSPVPRSQELLLLSSLTDTTASSHCTNSNPH